jgi:hypothetical protein
MIVAGAALGRTCRSWARPRDFGTVQATLAAREGFVDCSTTDSTLADLIIHN